MNEMPVRLDPAKCVVEVVRRLFVNGAILDQKGQRLVQIEICDTHSADFAYASDTTLPEIARIIDGEAYRCQLKWEKAAFPIGWRMLGLTRTPVRGDAAFELVPRTRILSTAHIVQFDVLISCIVEPTLRRFVSDVFSDCDFVMGYFSVPADSLGYAQNPETPLGSALNAISHYWYTPGLSEHQRQLGAVALLLTEPGLTWLASGGGQSALFGEHPHLPAWAVQDLIRVQPHWWRTLLMLWAEINATPVQDETFASPVMKAAYHLARVHARTIDQLKQTGEFC